MKDVDAPIIPVGLDGVWGSLFSFHKGRFLWKLPRRLSVSHHRQLRPTAAARGDALPGALGRAGTAIVEAWQVTAKRECVRCPSPSSTRRASSAPFRHGRRAKSRVSFGAALVRYHFSRTTIAENLVGTANGRFAVAPSVPGALVNHAALLLGKVPVNLNYTVSAETLASCIRQCDLKTVVTAKVFLDKLKLKLPCETVLLEEVAARPGLGEKLVASLIAWLVPDRWLQRWLGAERKTRLDDLATVIFSSGSTGDPKGVRLSHYNIGSNIEQLEQVFGLNHHDGFLGILPFFHSFGFTGTLCLPAMLGVGMVYHPNPLDAKAIGPLVREHQLTFLLATPTFLQLYLRSCAPEDFGSLRRGDDRRGKIARPARVGVRGTFRHPPARRLTAAPNARRRWR